MSVNVRRCRCQSRVRQTCFCPLTLPLHWTPGVHRLDVAAAANVFSQVLGFVVNVGEAVNIRVMQRPLMTCLLSLQA